MEITQTKLDMVQAQNKSIGKHGADFSLKKVHRVNYLGLIVFSIVFGLACSFVGDHAKPVLLVMKGISEAAMKITKWIIYLSPIGIAFLVASKIISEKDYGKMFERLGYYTLTVLLGLFIHGAIVLPLFFMLFTRQLPFVFIANMCKAMATAFGTASSSATVPVTLACLEENNGISTKITRFVIPIGATINMDGTALYEAVAPIFIAQLMNRPLGQGEIVVIAIVATAASVGAAGIPSAGLVTMAMVLDTVGIDSTHIGIILSVDWFLDRYSNSHFFFQISVMCIRENSISGSVPWSMSWAIH